MEFNHVPVLLQECLDGLNIKPDGIYLDGTAGGGGHSSEIARRLTTGHLYCFDKDEVALSAAAQRLKHDLHIAGADRARADHDLIPVRIEHEGGQDPSGLRCELRVRLRGKGRERI